MTVFEDVAKLREVWNKSALPEVGVPGFARGAAGELAVIADLLASGPQMPRTQGQPRSVTDRSEPLTPPLTEGQVRDICRRILREAGGGQAFPVGGIYINVTGVNPGTELGYGTWTAFGAGKVLVGFNSGVPPFDVLEAAIGSSTHTHAYTQVLNHTHVVDVVNSLHLHHIDINKDTPVLGGIASIQGSDQDPNATFDSQNEATGVTATTQNPAGGVASGTTAATANLPAALVVQFWKRTA